MIKNDYNCNYKNGYLIPDAMAAQTSSVYCTVHTDTNKMNRDASIVNVEKVSVNNFKVSDDFELFIHHLYPTVGENMRYVHYRNVSISHAKSQKT